MSLRHDLIIYLQSSGTFRLRNDLYCVGWGVKLSLLTHSLTPPYLNQLVRVADLPGHHRLRSSSSHRLQVPVCLLATVG